MKMTGFLVLGLLVCSSAFAMGSVSKKDKEYGDCVVNSPKVCGGYKAGMTQEEYKAFQACTSAEQKKCYEAFTKK